MTGSLLGRLERLVDHTDGLARAVPPDAFDRRLSDRSNTIGAQFWCVVGARESYLRAIEAGSWQGFGSSLKKVTDAEEVNSKLRSSGAALQTLRDRDDWSDARQDLLIDLLEHEALHQGQLIRYFYGLGISFPEAFARRWALSD